nr:unnamed protein product [Callosobruchus analis]
MDNFVGHLKLLLLLFQFVVSVQKLIVLLNMSTSELTLAHKLTEQHLHLNGSMRQRVRPAALLLSNTIAKAMKYCGENG